MRDIWKDKDIVRLHNKIILNRISVSEKRGNPWVRYRRNKQGLVVKV